MSKLDIRDGSYEGVDSILFAGTGYGWASRVIRVGDYIRISDQDRRHRQHDSGLTKSQRTLGGLMQFVPVDIANSFPVKLLCYPDGSVELVIQGGFPPIVEDRPTGVSSIFTMAGFCLRGEGEANYQEYYYNFPYHYKQVPTLKAWLVQQQLVSPFAPKEVEEETT
jgi:hypothetical protein